MTVNATKMPILKASIDCERQSGLISLLNALNFHSQIANTTAYLQISDQGIRCSLALNDSPPKLATVFLGAQEHFNSFTLIQASDDSQVEFTVKKSLQELLQALGYLQDLVMKSSTQASSLAFAERKALCAATLVYWEISASSQQIHLQLETLSLASGALCAEILLKGEAIVQDLGFLVSHPFDAELSAKAILNSKLLSGCFGALASGGTNAMVGTSSSFNSLSGATTTNGHGNSAASSTATTATIQENQDSEFEWKFSKFSNSLQLVATSSFHRSEYSMNTENVELCEYYECESECSFKVSGKKFGEFKEVLKLSSQASLSVFGGGAAMIVQLMVPMSGKCNVFVEYYP